MKKSVLTAAIAAVTGNALAVDVYNQDGATVNVFGEVRSKFTSVEDDNEGTQFSMSSSKLGTWARYDMDSGFYIKGLLRFTFDLNESGGVTLSKGYIETGSDEAGVFSIGRQGTVHDAMFNYDPSWSFGGDAKNGENIFGTDMIESGLVYTWTNGEFTFMAQHSTAEEDFYDLQTETKHGEAVNSNRRLKGNLDKTMAIGASWKSDIGLSLSGAYTTAKLDDLKKSKWVECKVGCEEGAGKDPVDHSGWKDDSINSKELKATSTGFQVGYSVGELSLAAAFFKFDYKADKKEDYDMEYQSYGLSASYKLESDVGVYAVYDYLDAKSNASNATIDVNGVDKKVKAKAERKTFTLGADYRPHKKVVTFAEYANVDMDFKDKYKYIDSKGKSQIAKSSKKNHYAIGARVYF